MGLLSLAAAPSVMPSFQFVRIAQDRHAMGDLHQRFQLASLIIEFLLLYQAGLAVAAGRFLSFLQGQCLAFMRIYGDFSAFAGSGEG